MAGPVSSIAYVPLHEVLPAGFARAEGRLRELATRLERHHSADRVAWRWYPEHVEPDGTRRVLVGTTITLYDTRDDWLELSLQIAWQPDGRLGVESTVEVACWCADNHNMHPVRESARDADDDFELADEFAAGVKLLTTVLNEGPFEPQPWRVAAGLPVRPR
ncbi:hypothetical protein Ade02nite_90960 [Paractinoplanes deccanensis]|uniref:Uncharacterized protein n=1 Tax=Paractinoplanes deccanensis TaxID=113561 RepID=A0ABQ3YKK1_9ACTN|nr:hypothetical protein [Actinoplanes deccanensis]GID80455.1 hypothetical protein Ade02nite_90960 [Actinoplanes deccanensis]